MPGKQKKTLGAARNQDNEVQQRQLDARTKLEAYQAAKRKERTYVVQAGDSLSKIAKEQLGDAARWAEIQKLNDIENPNLIRVGQELELPE